MNPHLEHRHLFHRVYSSLSVRQSRRLLLDSLLLQSVDPHDPMIGWREIDVATRSDLFGLCDLILSTWILSGRKAEEGTWRRVMTRRDLWWLPRPQRPAR